MNCKLICLIVTVLYTVGCARLEVAVDVLNPDAIEPRAEDDFIQDKMQIILVEDQTATKQRFLEIQNAHFQAYVAKSELLLNRAAETDDEYTKEALLRSADDLIAGFTEDIVPIYDSRMADWVATANEIRRLYAEYKSVSDPTTRARLRDSLVVNIESRATMTRQLTEFVNQDLDKKVEQLGQSQVNRIRTEVSTIAKELFDSGGLLHSRYTYFVVSAEDEEWADYYDRTFGRGTFGNTDIAIKALGTGNFTVKGLSFNPGDVANAASKVTTQAVLLAAQISGVPVTISGTPSGTGAQLAKSSSRIASARTEQAQVAANIQDQQEAMLRLMRAILDEQDILENGTDAQRAEAVAAINAVYESQLTRISVSVPVQGGTGNGN